MLKSIIETLKAVFFSAPGVRNLSLAWKNFLWTMAIVCLVSYGIFSMRHLPDDDFWQGVVYFCSGLIAAVSVLRLALKGEVADLIRHYGICASMWRKRALQDGGAYRLSNFLTGGNIPVPIALKFLSGPVKKVLGISFEEWNELNDYAKLGKMVECIPFLHAMDMLVPRNAAVGENWLIGTEYLAKFCERAVCKGWSDKELLDAINADLKLLADRKMSEMEEYTEGHFFVNLVSNMSFPFSLTFCYEDIKSVLGFYKYLHDCKERKVWVRNGSWKAQADVFEEWRTGFRLAMGQEFFSEEIQNALLAAVPELNRRFGASGKPSYIIYEAQNLTAEDVSRIEKAVKSIMLTLEKK